MLERAENKRGNIEIVGIEGLVPRDHLLRKIEKAVDFDDIYGMVEQYYCEDNGRPAADPVILVKIILIQHLFGIPSLRQTLREVEVNLACRWFLGLDLSTKPPHFATVSYAFCTRFPSEVARKIFSWILDAAVAKQLVKPEEAFIDGTQTKASANKNKSRKEQAAETAKVYDEQLREEINADRKAHGKKPLKDSTKEAKPKEVTVSQTDPDCGFFRKYEYIYDPENDCYRCPANQVLSYSTTKREGCREYKSKAQICADCPVRQKCTQSKACVKVITRHVWEGYLERAEEFRHTPEGKATYARRKETIERVFADMKEKHGGRYTHMRGLPRVTVWVGFKFAAMNLKKLACWAWRDYAFLVFCLLDAFFAPLSQNVYPLPWFKTGVL